MIDGFGMLGSSMMDGDPSPNPFALDLNNYLSSALSTSVEFQLIPQQDTAYPAISYSWIDGDADPLLSGPSGVRTDSWQFTSWALKPLDCAVGAEELRVNLDGYHGFMGSTEVLTCNLHKQFSARPNPIGNTDTVLHRIISEYTIVYRVSVRSFD